MKQLLLLLASILLLILGSCKEPCEDINCNAGDCIEGICNCDDGYDGTNCENEIRAKYYGTWTGPNMCDSTIGIDFDSITLTISESEVSINDLTMEVSVQGDFDVPLPPENATLFGNAFETGPSMVDIGFAVITFSSDGIFKSPDDMSLDFVITADEPLPITLNCTADLVKQ